MPATVPVEFAPSINQQADLQAAVDQAIAYLWRTQQPDGSWENFCEVGPVSTAQMHVTLHYLGRLEAADALEAAHWLLGEQREDRSW